MINKRIWATGGMLIAVIFIALLVNKRLHEREETPAEAVETAAEAGSEADGTAEETAADEVPEAAAVAAEPLQSEEFDGLYRTTVTVETDLFTAKLSNEGGVITSLVMKNYTDAGGAPIDLVLSENSGEYPFTLHFGTIENEPADELFLTEKRTASGKTVVEFSRDYRLNGGPVTVVKRYTFTDGEYLFRHEVDMNGGGDGSAAAGRVVSVPYALELGPQIGPDYQTLGIRTDYRHFVYQSERKKRSFATTGGSITRVEDLTGWCGIEGKYFSLLTVPPAEEYTVYLDSRSREGIRRRSALVLQNTAAGASVETAGDGLYFYFGPRKKEFLLRYNKAETNAFGVSGLDLDRSLAEPRLIGRIANVLKGILSLFYALVPNYGVAIVLLAVILRAALFPLALRQERMRTKAALVEKKVEEIKKKYPDDYSKAQREIQELYRRERIKPVSRMIPLLIQLPILFALYHLLSSHFDLRAAGFIGGWINDLSRPDVLADFYPNTLPVLKWHSFHLLPVLLLGLMLVQSRVIQPPPEGNRVQNVFSYLFPVVIFLIMYNLPSGLVLYFFLYTGLGILQHIIIEKYRGPLITEKIEFNG
jgi:YidC/Oxa1 family membrane protein insertase